MADCKHLREIIDSTESNHVCYDCGLVLDKHFEVYQAPPLDSMKYDYDEWAETAKDVLDRHHISSRYYTFVMKDFNKRRGRKTFGRLLFSIYKVLNSMNISMSLHDLSLSNGVSLSKIYSEQETNETVTIDMPSMAERYCKELNIDFPTMSVIKEMLKEPHNSGHTPATVVAATIFKVCKKRGVSISLKKISHVSSVSTISIQRFKNAFP